MGRDISVRLGGLLAMAVGGAVFWFFILLPLQRAQAGAAEISYSNKVFLLVPLFFVFVLGYV